MQQPLFYELQRPLPLNFGNMTPMPAYYGYYPNQQGLLYKEYLKSLTNYREQQFQYQLQNLYLSQLPQNPCFFETIKGRPIFTSKPIIFSEESYINPSFTKIEVDTPKTEESLSTVSSFTKKKEHMQNTHNDDLRAQVSSILHFVLTKFDKVSTEEIDQQRTKYSYNPALVELFDTLINKYTTSAKCREDMIRFIIRKAISTLRDDIRMKQNLSLKAASMALCKRYFQFMSNEDIQDKVDIENEEELLSFLLPYKKNSRNKTANTCFITEIFSSEAFYQDYQEYLTKLDEILEADNKSKIERFTKFLVNCVKENSLHKVKGFRRLPWPEVWNESTKVIAYELLDANTWKTINKKPKVKGVKKLKTSN